MQPQRNFDTGIVAPTDNLALKKAGPGQRRRLPLRFVAALAVTVVLLASFAALVALPLKGAVVTAASPCPAVNDWCTTMTVADAEGDGLLHGYEFDKFGSIVDDTIQPGGANINVWTVHTFAHPHPQLPDYIFFGSNPRVPRGTQVTIEGHTFIADAESHDGEEGDTGDKWEFPSGELPASLVWSAGQEVTVSVKLASPCDNLDNLVNAIVVKNLTGEITQAGDTNLHKIRLDPYKSYLIEAIGVDGSDMLGVEEHPNLTLEDPEIPAIWNARGTSELITYGSKSDGNAIRRILRTDHRTYKIEVSSGNNGTGTYQLKVRVNNICRINDDGDVQYQWAGGPEGYLTGVGIGFLRWDMASNLQVELGFWPGFGQQPDAAPEAALEQQAPEPVDAVADHAHGARRTAPRVTVIGSQRFGRRPQVAWSNPPLLGVLHPGAIGQGQQGGHPGRACRETRVGSVRRVLSHFQPRLLRALKPNSIQNRAYQLGPT